MAAEKTLDTMGSFPIPSKAERPKYHVPVVKEGTGGGGPQGGNFTLAELMDGVEGRVDALETDTGAMAERLTTVEQKNTEQDTAIRKNAEDINLKANASDIYNKSDIDGMVADINAQIGAIGTALDTINGEVI